MLISGNNQHLFFEDYYKTSAGKRDIPDFKITDYKNVSGKQILSIGVGTGRDTSYLANKNTVHGVDVSETGLKIAKKKGIKVKVVDVDRNKLPYKDKTFDIIICKDLFEHLVNPLSLLQEIKRVVKKGGYLVVNVPNHFFWLPRLRILFGSNLLWKVIGQDQTKMFNEWDYMHIRYFTWEGFQHFLRKGGFRIRKTFWDFGTLTHYNNPEFVIPYLKRQPGRKSAFEMFIIKYGEKLWSVFNFIFPKKLRAAIVSLSPSFLSSSFYVWCVPGNDRDVATKQNNP